MAKVSYTKANTSTLLAAGSKKVGKIPFGNLKMKPAPYGGKAFMSTGKFKKGQTLGAQAPFKGADINKAPGYSKMKKQIQKKGITKNYSM